MKGCLRERRYFRLNREDQWMVGPAIEWGEDQRVQDVELLHRPCLELYHTGKLIGLLSIPEDLVDEISA